MSNEMIPRAQRREIAATETLEQLAQIANVAHMRAVETAHNAVELALEAGQALLEAKKRCPSGNWHAWLNLQFRGSIRTAQAYMRLAAHAPHIKYDAQRVAHLTHQQLRCLMAGLAATDGRAKPVRRTRAAVEAPAFTPSLPPEQRGCGAPTCLPRVSVGAEFCDVAESLLETLRQLAELAETQTAGDYAMHLFERLRMVYFGLERQQWFYDWQVNPVADPKFQEQQLAAEAAPHEADPK